MDLELRASAGAKWKEITLLFTLSSYTLLGTRASTFVDSDAIIHTHHTRTRSPTQTI